MDPTVWGPKLWFVIHTVALNFPDNPTYEIIRQHEDFFNNLKYIIPCDKCRLHYTQRLDKNPVTKYLKDSNTLFKYTIDLHNEVNKSLDKKIYSYDEVVDIYKKHYSNEPTVEKCVKSIFNLKNTVILGILVSLVSGVIYYKNRYVFKVIRK